MLLLRVALSNDVGQLIREAIKAAASDTQYERLRQRFENLAAEFWREAGIAAYPSLKVHAKRALKSTPDEMRQLTRYVNKQLRDFGLTLQDPLTGETGFLVVQTKQRGQGRQRIMFEIATSSRENRTRVGLRQDDPLAELVVIPRSETQTAKRFLRPGPQPEDRSR